MMVRNKFIYARPQDIDKKIQEANADGWRVVQIDSGLLQGNTNVFVLLEEQS